MKRLRPLPINLRVLILLFVLVSVFATLCNSLIVAYRVQSNALIQSELESNSAYAAKVASSIEAFLQSAQSRMNYSAEVLAFHWPQPKVLQAEAERLQRQDGDFNAVAIVDTDGKVLHMAPGGLLASGVVLKSESMRQALRERGPVVSSAYTSASGHLVIFISQPIISASGKLLGVIGGSVYLQQQSALYTLISSHFHHEGTFVVVADRNRRLLNHPDPQRIGEIFGPGQEIDATLRGASGALEVEGDEKVPMLAGYAQVPDARWVVVALQPREKTLAPLVPLFGQMVIGMLPAGIAGFGLIVAFTTLIARPLRQLSSAATQLAAPEAEAQLLRVQAWYQDASAIRRALLSGVKLMQQKLGHLSHEAQSDPLTGLSNRRAMEAFLEMLMETDQLYAVIALDIDHFKRVNDTYGHDAGDVALKHIAEILKANSRASDLTCRAGGEEFTLVMPNTSIAFAITIAERIRENVATSDIPGIGKLTLSAGVAYADEKQGADAILKLADERLYLAKQTGRNRVVAG